MMRKVMVKPPSRALATWRANTLFSKLESGSGRKRLTSFQPMSSARGGTKNFAIVIINLMVTII